MPLDERQLRNLGREAAALLSPDKPDWLHRRVENIAFVDNRVVRHRVSVDFDVPDGLTPIRDDLLYVPVGALAKFPPLLRLDLRDDCGNTGHLLTTGQNTVADEALLVRLQAAARPAFATDPSIRELLAGLARSPALGRRTQALRDLRGMIPPANTSSELARFWLYAEQAASHLVLWFPIRGKPGERKVVNFEYDYFDESRKEPVRRLVRSLSWSPRDKYYSIAQASHGGSYHLAVETPPLLHVRKADIGFIQPRGSAPVRAHLQVEGPRVHVYLPGPRSSLGFLSLQTVATRRGVISAALFAAIAVAALLIALALLNHVVAQQTEPTVAILLLVPALFGAFVIRPADHPLAAEHISGVRALALGIGVLPAIGSVFVLGYVGNPACIGRSLGVLAALATLLVVALLRSWHVAGPNFPTNAGAT